MSTELRQEGGQSPWSVIAMFMIALGIMWVVLK